jgi:monothiol glutaredoxin
MYNYVFNFYFHLGEFIGGCDILMEMHRSGDIIEELEKIGIKSIAPEKQ